MRSKGQFLICTECKETEGWEFIWNLTKAKSQSSLALPKPWQIRNTTKGTHSASCLTKHVPGVNWTSQSFAHATGQHHEMVTQFLTGDSRAADSDGMVQGTEYLRLGLFLLISQWFYHTRTSLLHQSIVQGEKPFAGLFLPPLHCNSKSQRGHFGQTRSRAKSVSYHR